MNRHALWLGLAVTALIAATLGALRLTEHSRQAAPRSQGRVVLVSHTMPRPSLPGQPLHVKLISAATFRDQSGVVLSDDQCQPDSAGISHCLNTIRLASGQTISVRHPHDMRSVACLTPGEHVAIRMTA